MKSVKIVSLMLVVAMLLTVTVTVVGTPAKVLAAGNTYYVDSVGGFDDNDGKSAATAWSSLEKVNATTFEPGDSILFKSGCSWTGQLYPKGSGSAEGGPITVDMYGTGNKPVINGAGAPSTVYLKNQEYWEISNLEVTNNPDTPGNVRGVDVLLEEYGRANHIYLRNLYIHDVKASMTSSYCGGILFEALGTGDARTGTPSMFNDIKVENCSLYKLDKFGIQTRTVWCNRSSIAENDEFYPNTGVVIRGNTLDDIGANGIVTLGCKDPLVEYNYAYECGKRLEGACVAMWPYASSGAVFQYNEVAYTRKAHATLSVDSEGFDCDWLCNDTVFQYNYGHGNEGGFMLICCNSGTAGSFNDRPVIRYNIGEANLGNMFIVAGNTTDASIYNNTLYLPGGEAVDTAKRMLWIKRIGSIKGILPTNTVFKNNIFYSNNSKSVQGVQFYSTPRDGMPGNLDPLDVAGYTGATFENNCFAGAYHYASEPQNDDTSSPNIIRNNIYITEDTPSLFEGIPGLGANKIDMRDPNRLSAYKLKPGSPCINTGAVIANNGGKDFWGNTLYCGAPDIGAHEYQDTQIPTWTDGSVTASDVMQTSLMLSWSGAADNTAVVSYAVYKEGDLLGTVSESTYNIENLTPNTPYIFRIEAMDAFKNISNTGPSVTVTTLPVPNSTVTPVSGSFDKKLGAQADVEVTVEFNGNTLNAINNENTVLTEGMDYTVAGSVYTIRSAYLAAQSVGTTTLTFDFSAGASRLLSISISDSTDNTTGDVPGDTTGQNTNGIGVSPVVPAETPKLKVDTATGKITVEVRPVLEAGTAKAEISAATMAQAVELAEADIDSIKKISIDIPKVQGAKGYELALPGTALTQTALTHKVEMTTDVAKLEIPSNLLKASDTSLQNVNVAVSVAAVDKSMLDAESKEVIGDRPVIEVNLKIDGKVASWSNPSASVSISIPYKPTSQELKNSEHIVVYYMDGKGNIVVVPSGKYNTLTGEVTFTTTHFSKYGVGYVEKSFSDIGEYGWAKKEIEVLASKGIIEGTGGTAFTPAENITRADFVVLLVKSLALSAEVDGNFNDIAADAYYYGAIGIARKLGISEGRGDNRFDPQDKISRQEMMVLTARAMKLAGKLNNTGSTAGQLDRFADKNAVDSYAVDIIAALVKAGMVQGQGSKLNPAGNATRAETAVLMYRVYSK